MSRLKSSVLNGAVAAVASIALGGTLTVATTVSASSTNTKKLTPLQKGLAFYQGKTITFISPSLPGGGIDFQVRTEGALMAQYLHATINVENIPAGNSIAGQDAAAAAPSDGLTLGYMNPLTDVAHFASHSPGLTFDPNKIKLIASSPEATYVWIVSTAGSCPSIKTWGEALQAGTAASPLKELLGATGAATTLAILAHATFTSNHIALVAGYSTTALLTAGFNRGDGCMEVSSSNSAAPIVSAGKAFPLMVGNKMNPANAFYKYYAAAPTVAKVIKSDSKFISTTRAKLVAQVLAYLANNVGGGGPFLQRGAPEDLVLAMRAAAKWAMTTPTYKSEELANGNNPGWVSPVTGMAQIIAAEKAAAPVKSLLAGS